MHTASYKKEVVLSSFAELGCEVVTVVLKTKCATIPHKTKFNSFSAWVNTPQSTTTKSTWQIGKVKPKGV